jgi:drug/metabolite transporter (DMT)-like permease
VVLGVVCTLIAHTLWIKVSTELPGNITATVYYFYVPLAMGFSYFLFDEQLSWQKITGASLIILANITVMVLHRRKA